jgi:hypothetical protein
MKRLFLVSASLLLTSASFAQTTTLYRFDNAGTPKEVSTLGATPEFPFLRNMTSAHQVYAAIERHANDNTAAANKMNGLLMQLGYANGAKDLRESDISLANIKPGTEGNMGSRGYVYSYTRLTGDASEYKAWKIAANDNSNAYGAVYLFAKCGNAFYPKNTKSSACITVPVSVTPDMNQVSLPASGTKVTTSNETYVYYSRKRHMKHDAAYPVAGIGDKYPSKPLRISAATSEQIVPETYTVNATGAQTSVYACTDKTLNLTANIDLEKTSSYTGNYPKSDNKTYKKVSKRHYKMIARRTRRIERKENKIARKTGVPVDVRTAKL